MAPRRLPLKLFVEVVKDLTSTSTVAMSLRTVETPRLPMVMAVAAVTKRRTFLITTLLAASVDCGFEFEGCFSDWGTGWMMQKET